MVCSVFIDCDDYNYWCIDCDVVICSMGVRVRDIGVIFGFVVDNLVDFYW